MTKEFTCKAELKGLVRGLYTSSIVDVEFRNFDLVVAYDGDFEKRPRTYSYHCSLRTDLPLQNGQTVKVKGWLRHDPYEKKPWFNPQEIEIIK